MAGKAALSKWSLIVKSNKAGLSNLTNLQLSKSAVLAESVWPTTPEVAALSVLSNETHCCRTAT